MKKILIVEDEDRMRKLVKDYLVKWGYEVVEADDGYKALEVYNKEQPDLIILDVMIPGIEGYEVAYEIKKISSVPIIMLTAKSEEYDELNGFKCGADDYVRKPFSPKILMARIEALLRYVDKFVETKEEFTSCKEHIKSLENLYDLMKKKGEKREDIIAQQYLTL